MWLSDAYILVSGTISAANTTSEGATAKNNNKKLVFKNCTLFNDCISKINNTQVDNAKDIDIVITMYYLIECRDDYLKSLWQF